MKKLLLILSVSLFFMGCKKGEPQNETSGPMQDPGFIQQEILKTQNPATGIVESDKLWSLLLKQKHTLGNAQLNKAQLRYVNTWRPVDDFFASLSVSRIVADPNNEGVMYFCTGEGFLNEFPSKAASIARGAGVWKSDDFGETWNLLPATNNDSFMFTQDMLVHPSTGDIYVATRLAGLMRSQDEGNSWESVLGLTEGSTSSDGAADIEMTKDGNLVVSLGIFDTDGIYFSETGDKGDWEKRMTGITGNSITRIEIATAPSLEGRIYAITCNSSNQNRVGGVFRSDDNGNQWEEVSMPGNSPDTLARKQAWYDLAVKVDPKDADIVLAGGLNIWRSRDAGDSWQQLTEGDLRKKTTLQYVHVDQHEIVFKNSDTAYFTNDGGIYRCDNISADTPSFIDLNLNYNVTQYYSCAIHPEKGHYFIFGGTQDNGSSGSTGAGISAWKKLSWADGSYSAIDPIAGEFYFTTTQYKRIYRFRPGGIDTITNPSKSVNDNTTLFINPIEIDPVAGDILYQGSSLGLWRLKNARTASKDDWELATRSVGGISAIGIAVDKPNTIFLGRSGGGRIYRINDASTTDRFYFPDNADPNLDLPTAGYISSISVDPTDASHVLVSFSNYGLESVWESHNALDETPSWTSVEGNLPDIPVRWLTLHHANDEVCYLGTDAGVYVTDQLDGENTVWRQINDGLANIRIDMIRYRKSDHTYVAATHGRGMYTGIPKSDNSILWEERGPRNVGGRTRTLLVDPWNATHKELWAGSVSGGLWHLNNEDDIAETELVYDPYSAVIYPNPTPNGEINIRITGTNGTNADIVLYNLAGQLIHKGVASVGETGEVVYTIGSSAAGQRLAAGLYFVKVSGPDQEEVFRVLYK